MDQRNGVPGLRRARIRENFPARHQQANGHQLSYLDTAAPCHKPHENPPMSVAMTAQLENTRQLIAAEFNASKDEIIFVRGCPESINLICHLLRARYSEGRRRSDCCDDGPP